jgi:TM2 domain-containing membrane protein YozV
MAKSKKGYLDQGFSDIVNLVLAIIPFTSWILGGLTRIMRGQLIAGILQLIPPITLVFWILDIISVAQEGDLTFYA